MLPLKEDRSLVRVSPRRVQQTIGRVLTIAYALLGTLFSL